MNTDSFFLLEDQDRHVIVHTESGLKINVFGLEVEEYEPADGELHLFGDDHGAILAFETETWDGEDAGIIRLAAQWYARYLDFPQMVIEEEDPRPVNRLRKHTNI